MQKIILGPKIVYQRNFYNYEVPKVEQGIESLEQNQDKIFYCEKIHQEACVYQLYYFPPEFCSQKSIELETGNSTACEELSIISRLNGEQLQKAETPNCIIQDLPSKEEEPIDSNFKLGEKQKSKRNFEHHQKKNKFKKQTHAKQELKTSWSREEDQFLIDLVNLIGKKWSEISKKFGDHSYYTKKSGKQIRERYMNYLRPNLSTKKWSKTEDNLLVDLIKHHGRSWEQISKIMKNRSQNQIKNRYYGNLQKKMEWLFD